MQKMKIQTQIGLNLKPHVKFGECRRAFLNLYGMYSPSTALAFATQLTDEQLDFLKNDPTIDADIKKVLESL